MVSAAVSPVGALSEAAQPNRSWVTSITYFKTHVGWMYLAVVVDLLPPHVVGWSTSSRTETSLVLDTLLMALGRHRSEDPVTVTLIMAAKSLAMDGRRSYSSTTCSAP